MSPVSPESSGAPRVLLDATAVPADRGGVGRYVDGLIGALASAGQSTSSSSASAPTPSASPGWPRASRSSPGPSAISHRPARLAWEQTGLPLVAQQVGAEVIHSPYYTMPLHAPVPVVVTVHDVTFFSEPELHSAVKTGFYRSATRTAVRRATRVVVPSQATRDELVRLLDADAERIDVAPHGVDLPPSARRRRPRRAGSTTGSACTAGRTSRSSACSSGARTCPTWSAAGSRPSTACAEPPALVLAGSSGWDDGVDQAVAEVPDAPEDRAPGLPAPRRPAGPARRRDGRGLPEQGRGLRAAGARGDGLRRGGADRAPAVAARGRRRRGRLHRARRRRHRDDAARADRRPRAPGACCRRSGVARAREFTWEASAAAHLATYARAAGAVDRVADARRLAPGGHERR